MGQRRNVVLVDTGWYGPESCGVWDGVADWDVVLCRFVRRHEDSLLLNVRMQCSGSNDCE